MFYQNKKELFFSLIVFISIFLLTEIVLRLVYDNPYGVSNAQQLSSLEQNIPGLVNKFKTFDNTEVMMRVGDKYEVVSGKPYDEDLPDAHFIGGSTTKCHNIPEGERWTDLIKGYNTYNHGVLARNLLENYFNLAFYIDEGAIKNGDTVFLMHSVNDLVKIIKKYKSAEIDTEENIFDVESYKKSKALKGLLSKHSYFYALIREAIHKKKLQKRMQLQKSLLIELQSNNQQKEQKKKSIQKQNNQSGLSKQEFDKYFQLIKSDLKHREELLNEFKKLCDKHKLQLIILTQPNSFVPEFSLKYLIDDYPKISNKKLSKEQARKLLNLVNQQNIDFAKQNNLIFIDVNKKFLGYDPNPLFQDSVHYTEEGAKVFAEIVNKELKLLEE